MSKWRPSKYKNIYVIPDVHGRINELKLILNRILPLRKDDEIVFLGDYIDRDKNSHLVVDLCIDLQKHYLNQVVCIQGNHESMLLDAISPSNNSNKYLFWMKNGGEHSLVGYLERSGIYVDSPYSVDRNRIKDFIPENHKQWFRNLPVFYETDKYKFVHGGCDPLLDLDKQDPNVLIWDRSIYNFVKKIQNYYGNTESFSWNKTIVTGHNGEKDSPLITDKFMMLDCSVRKFLLVYELNSRTGFEARYGKERLVKFSE